MARVCFQNGPDAPEILLDEEIDSDASDAKERLAECAHHFGTVEGAVAWFEGDKKPKGLEPAEAEIPATSVLVEHVPAAPPSPEVQAKEQRRIEKAEEDNQAARDEAAQANADAHAKAEEAEAEKKTEAAKSKK